MLSPDTIIQSFGYLGLFGILFAETGLLVGFFLPGDTLLLAAGAASRSNLLLLPMTILACFIGSFLGDQLAYYIGNRAGPRIFNRPESRLFDPKNVEKAKTFFDKYGLLSVVVARFIPVMRAFVPTMAGVSGFKYANFLPLSLIGAAAWATSIVSLGYFVSGFIPKEQLEKYIYLVVIVGVLAGVLPSLWHVFGPRKKH